MQPVAQALASMLKRAEPPICVGLYARWGSGKTFMISLLKKEFDPTVLEEPRTRKLLQFFEKGYKELAPKEAPEPDTVSSLICGLLRTILRFIVSIPRDIFSLLPYGVTTFFSIISDAFDIRGAIRAVWAWCSRLRRSCAKKGRTTDSSEVSARGGGSDGQPWRTSFLAKLRKGYSLLSKEELKKVKRKEFIFVDFNAWECAA